VTQHLHSRPVTGIRLERRPGWVLTSENPWVGRPAWGFGCASSQHLVEEEVRYAVINDTFGYRSGREASRRLSASPVNGQLKLNPRVAAHGRERPVDAVGPSHTGIL